MSSADFEYTGARFAPHVAIELLAKLRSSNVVVLGTDGFIETAGGMKSSLDLCLDVSSSDIPQEERFTSVEAFIRQHTIATSWELVW